MINFKFVFTIIFFFFFIFPVSVLAQKQQSSQNIDKYHLSQILTYKKLIKYHESPLMHQFVLANKIPPIQKRLPKAPQVMMSTAMTSGPGQYGGVWRGVWAYPTQGYHFLAGQTAGWFGINAILIESLVKTGPIWMRNDNDGPLPNLATSWKWSKDGYKLTMHLIEGAKWSDGHPFNAEDVVFSYVDNIMNDKIKGFADGSSFQTENKQGQSVDAKLTALDDFTIEWTFASPFPKHLLYRMTFMDFPIMPAHILKPFHPRYNSKANYSSYATCLAPEKTDLLVTLSPWVVVKYDGKNMIMRPNPFYWKVDEKGQQLPYLNEVNWTFADKGIARTHMTMDGLADHTNFEEPVAYDDAIRKGWSRKSHFRISWSEMTLSFRLVLNLAKNLGVHNEKDKQIRSLLRNVEFRKALSHALDRKLLSQTISKSGIIKPYAGGINPGSSYYDSDSVVQYTFDPSVSKSLLAKLGFKNLNQDKYLEWTTGPLKGQALEFSLSIDTAQITSLKISRFLTTAFADIGIKIIPLKETDVSRVQKWANGQWEIVLIRTGHPFNMPYGNEVGLVPISMNRGVNTLLEHRADKDHPFVLMPFEHHMIDIIKRFTNTDDFNKRKSLIAEYNHVYTQNLYSIGLIVAPYGLGLAKRFENINNGLPVNLYQWTWNNGYFERVWIKPKNRLSHAEMMPDSIPFYH